MSQIRRMRILQLAVTLLVAGACITPLVRGQGAPSTKPAAVPYVREPLQELKDLKPVVMDIKTPDDLRAIQQRVEIVARNALPAIVNIQIRSVNAAGDIVGEQGSGVIVSKDG